MVKIAIFASGNGSNFESLAKYFSNDKKNNIAVLICNKRNAFAINRSKRLKIPYKIVEYKKGKTKDAEELILKILKKNTIDIVFLAGFMKVLSADFLQQVSIPVINIHPSLLPKHKGLNAIEKAYNSNDSVIGITIHYVDEKIDSGEIILQKDIPLDEKLKLKDVEEEIHKLEHKWYPVIAKKICEKIKKNN